MNEIFNPAPVAPVSMQSDVFNQPRFSNYDGEGSDTTSTDGKLGQDNTGSGIWDNVGGWLNSVSDIVTGIWGTSDKYMANAYQTMYNQERKTNNMLIGIVVAIVLLAFAFLIIKKK